MSRITELQYRLLEYIRTLPKTAERDETLEWEQIHMASASRTAYLLALERGIDPELPACAASVHDFGRILTGKQSGHAEAGYLPVRDFLRSTGLFTTEEIDTISLAVKNHSSKTVAGTPIEEIVKDADVIDCYQYGTPFDRPEKEIRYRNWLKNTKTGEKRG